MKDLIRATRRHKNRVAAARRQKIVNLLTDERYPLGMLTRDLHHTVRKWFFDPEKRRIENQFTLPQNALRTY